MRKGAHGLGQESEAWSLDQWISGMQLDSLISTYLLNALSCETHEECLEMVKALGSRDKEACEGAILNHITESGLVEALVGEIAEQAALLSSAIVSSPLEFHKRQQKEKAKSGPGTIDMAFEGLDALSLGLEEVIGPVPKEPLLPAIFREHCATGDSHVEFTISRSAGGVTTSATEWAFVFDADGGYEAAWERTLQKAQGNTESKLEYLEGVVRGLRQAEQPDPSAAVSSWDDFRQLATAAHEEHAKSSAPSPDEASLWPHPKAQPRAPRGLASFRELLAQVNSMLASHGLPALLAEELIAARLFTGPMINKYKAVFWAHGKAGQSAKRYMRDACGDNLYPVTIYLLQSAFTKLGKLLPPAPMYYGLCKGVLPRSFWEGTAFGFKGGVDKGFKQTTMKREDAFRASQGDGNSLGTLLEIFPGSDTRFADLGWLSLQMAISPKDDERFIFPASVVTVSRMTLQENVLVVQMRLSFRGPVVLAPFSSSKLESAQLLSEIEEDVLKSLRKDDQQQIGAKFGGNVQKMMTGAKDLAAKGLYHFLSVPDPLADVGTAKLEAEFSLFILHLKMQAMTKTGAAEVLKHWQQALVRSGTDVKTVEEVVAAIESEILDNLMYVLNAEAGSSSRRWPNGMADRIPPSDEMPSDRQVVMLDGTVRGMTLDDFCQHEIARKAGLSRVHVAALRLYTTSLFKYINNPLREQAEYFDKNIPHPLPQTVAYINEAVKKLRATSALDQSSTTRRDLWRGMKNLSMDNAFLENRSGGTELGAMSTTTEIGVAAKYSQSDHALLLKLKVNNFMQVGASLSWLSAFPEEEEVLYPPLTYLQPTGLVQEVKVASGTFQIVEVEPHIG